MTTPRNISVDLNNLDGMTPEAKSAIEKHFIELLALSVAEEYHLLLAEEPPTATEEAA